MTLRKSSNENKIIQQWGTVMAVFLLVGIILLVLLLNYQSATAAEMLPVSINSNRLADYSADPFGLASPLPTIKVEALIQSIIEDEQPTNVPERLATLESLLLTPVPSATPAPTNTPTPTLLPGTPFTPISQSPTATISLFGTVLPSPTATLLPGVTPPTATNTLVPTNSPVPTNTPSPTDVSSPTPTAKNKPTERALTATAEAATAAVSPTMTNTLPPGITPSRTPVPSNTPTLTNTPVPTNTSTPTNSPVPSNTPIPTNTPTRTPTSTATIASCTAPDPVDGFVTETTPQDGETNVSRNAQIKIEFNQEMNPKEATKQIKISGPGGPRYKAVYDPATNTVTLTLSKSLRANTEYELTIRSRVKNVCGQRQDVDVTITFTTGN